MAGTTLGLAALAALSLAACAGGGPEGGGVEAEVDAFDDAARARVEAAVDSATRAFETAERARDAEAVVGHFAPDFSIFNDGARVDYEEAVAGARAWMPTLQHFEPGWVDLRVRALSPTLAISSFTFNDSIVDADGNITLATGPTSLVWERRAEEWLIIYADADHYAVP